MGGRFGKLPSEILGIRNRVMAIAFDNAALVWLEMERPDAGLLLKSAFSKPKDDK
jgi:hypothetical protein